MATFPLYQYKGSFVLVTDEYNLHHEKTQSNAPIITPQLVTQYLEGRKLVVIDSIKSGKGRNSEQSVYHNVLKELFKELGIEHDYISTSTASSISEFASSLKNGVYTVLFISGDTSVNEFVNALLEVDHGEVTFGIIPQGTGNSIALSLGSTSPFTSLQRFYNHIREPTAVSLNTYEAQFPSGSHFIHGDTKGNEIDAPLRFVVVLSWAFHAALVADSDTPELRKHGVNRFRIAAESNLTLNTFYDGSYTIGEKVYDGPFAYWLVTATSRFEEKFLILPKGDILARDAYLVLFKAQDDPSGAYIMKVMEEVYLEGKHVDNPDVSYVHLDSEQDVTLSIDSSDQRLCLDGAIVKIPQPGKVTVKVLDNQVKNWKLYIIN